MCVALHDEPVRTAEPVEQREIFFHRRIGRRVAAAGSIRKFICRAEDMSMRIPCTGWRHHARLFRLCDGPGDARWFSLCVHGPVLAELDTGVLKTYSQCLLYTL